MTKQTTRRDMIKGSVALAGLGVLGQLSDLPSRG